jgi:glycosyltransferase involved in cell wall biosynthesis
VIESPPTSARPTVGYVHAGPLEHGVSRYGRLLAAEARRRADLRVLEGEIVLTGAPHEDRRRVAEAASRLAGADLVHLQYNNQPTGSVWGPGWRQFLHLRLFAQSTRAPLVATLHDLYPASWPGWRSSIRHPVREIHREWRDSPPAMTLRWLRGRAAGLFVCTHEERSRLVHADGRLRVIPHFVEPRVALTSQPEARDGLGLAGKRVVTLLGYIHGRKGHRLLIEALPLLPENVVAVFAGAPPPSHPRIVSELLALAQARGVADRLQITGYLSEHELESYLAATDVAVCPFTSMAASSSLSTWISTGRPIVATELPQMAEYNAFEQGAIRTFHPYTPGALAEAIRAVLENSEEGCHAVARLRTRLLLPRILDSHIEAYRELIG